MKTTMQSHVTTMQCYGTTMQCHVISNKRYGNLTYALVFESAELARVAAPGQFAMIRCGGGTYLRRPFSFCDANANSGAVTIMYRLAGAGTLALSQLAAGDSIDVLGPLGKGFNIMPGSSAIVGGGIGVFPLLLLARRLRDCGIAPDVFAGFPNSESVLLADEMKRLSHNYTLTSDDGSLGAKGFVTDAFAKAISDGEKYATVYACGPVPMLAELKNICEKFGIFAQFSLEQRMGCGIGACLVCACAVKSDVGDAHGADCSIYSTGSSANASSNTSTNASSNDASSGSSSNVSTTDASTTDASTTDADASSNASTADTSSGSSANANTDADASADASTAASSTVCKAADDIIESASHKYVRVCCDGPVFSAHTLVFDGY